GWDELRPGTGCEPAATAILAVGSGESGLPRRCRTHCPRPQPSRSSFSVLVTAVAWEMSPDRLRGRMTARVGHREGCQRHPDPSGAQAEVQGQVVLAATARARLHLAGEGLIADPDDDPRADGGAVALAPPAWGWRYVAAGGRWRGVFPQPGPRGARGGTLPPSMAANAAGRVASGDTRACLVTAATPQPTRLRSRLGLPDPPE